MASLHQLVKEHLPDHANKIAVQFDNGTFKSCMTYKELWNRANIVCDVLRERGLEHETVGVCVPSSADLPSTLLGVLQTPASFYPFDGDGQDMIEYTLRTLGVRFMLVHIDLLQKLDGITRALGGALVPGMELLDLGLILVSFNNAVHKRVEENLAYCITTSGSTSTPKVVQVPHRSIIPNITQLRKLFGVKSDDMCFLASPLTFDPSIVEMFMALTSGATLLITTDDVKASPNKLLDVIYRRNKVSVLQMTPALLLRFTRSVLKSTLLGLETNLRVLALGGEKLPPRDFFLSVLTDNCNIKFFNLYGITEVSCWAMCFKFDRKSLDVCQEDIPLGSVMDGTEVKVINQRSEEVTSGTGRLLIGSSQRVCELGDDVQLTTTGEMMWRDSGDIVQVLDNGNIVYVGRTDDQVKRNGKRLNLSAIEHAVLKLTSITECKVLFHQNLLLLFAVSDTFHDSTQHASFKMEVVSHLQKALSLHYQLDHIILVDALPLTKHGKLDRQLLLRTWDDMSASLPPREVTDVYTLCKNLWKDTLPEHSNYKEIDDNSEFLNLGGDSILAVSVINSTERLFGGSAAFLLDTLLNKTFGEFVRDVRCHIQSISFKDEQKIEKTQRKSISLQAENRQESIQEGTKDRLSFKTNREPFYPELNLSLKGDNSDSGDDHGGVPGNNLNFSEVKVRENMTEVTRNSENQGRPKEGSTSTAEVRSVGTVSRGSKYEGHISVDIVRESCIDEVRDVELLWKYDTGKCVDASPVVSINSSGNHTVYIGSHSHVMSAIDLSTGSEVWRTLLEDRIESSACVSKCGKWVIVGCYDNCVYVLCSATGMIKWKYKTGGCVKSSPSLDPLTSRIIIGSHDQSLHAIDIYEEKCIWKSSLQSGSIFSSPCVSSHYRHVYVGTLAGKLHAVNTDTGEHVWSVDLRKPVFSSPAESSTSVVVGSVDGSIYCYCHQGTKKWQFLTNAPVFSSPVIISAPDSCLDKKGSHQVLETVVVGSHDEHVHCLTMSGDLVWKFKTNSPVYATPFMWMSLKNSEMMQTQDDDAEDQHHNKDCRSCLNLSPNAQLHYQTELSNGISFDDHDRDAFCGHVMEEQTSANKTALSDMEVSGVPQHLTACGVCEARNTSFWTEEPSVKKPKLSLANVAAISIYASDGSVVETQQSCHASSVNSMTLTKVLSTCSEQDITRKDLNMAAEFHMSDLLHGGYNNSSGKMYVGLASTAGNLAVLDAKSGNAVTSVDLPGEVFSSPILIGKHVVVGCRDNFVYCFQLIGDRVTELRT